MSSHRKGLFGCGHVRLLLLVLGGNPEAVLCATALKTEAESLQEEIFPFAKE